MNTAIFYFVGGDAFFSGFVAVAAGAIVIFASRGDRYRIGRNSVRLAARHRERHRDAGLSIRSFGGSQRFRHDGKTGQVRR
jgi:hypothetical protein